MKRSVHFLCSSSFVSTGTIAMALCMTLAVTREMAMIVMLLCVKTFGENCPEVGKFSC